MRQLTNTKKTLFFIHNNGYKNGLYHHKIKAKFSVQIQLRIRVRVLKIHIL